MLYMKYSDQDAPTGSPNSAKMPYIHDGDVNGIRRIVRNERYQQLS